MSTIVNLIGDRVPMKGVSDDTLFSEETMRNLRFANDDLRRQLYILENRFNAIAERLGYPSVDDLEEFAYSTEIKKFTLDSTNQVKSIGSPHEEGTYCSPCKRKHGNRRTRDNCIHHKPYQQTLVNKIEPELANPPRKSYAVQSQDKCTLKEYESLSRKYDALLASKRRAEQKYKEDYKKWKSFKSWLMSKSSHRSSLRSRMQEDISLQSELATDHGQISLDTDTCSVGDSDEELYDKNGLLRKHRNNCIAAPSCSTSKRNHDILSSPCARVKSRDPIASQHSSRIRKVVEKSDSESENVSPLPCGHTKTINALYKIDATRNGGKSFQFDEVVRNKEKRRQLEAGDCDCCKDYYDNINPLPDVLLPPAWSSPKRKLLQEKHVVNAEGHKKRISRHRHQWTPPKTPPGYWNIGFPTTQEADDINKKAANMHEEKRRRIEDEVLTSGRYIRRQKAD